MLVVTQKIVSKAEGAVVDLTTVEPRREAIKFAERFDRDPRQIEVVLREARRVVRMQNGVLITETAHGFVCANGGIDASNVGPGVRLGRDAAAGRSRRFRDADPRGHPGRYGVDVPVVMSDSFGRPWRWGIVDVAIGVSGLLPLEDLRGVPDADGRVMKSTVRAVADELASAAELALGKTAGRPVALVRGASFTRGEATIRDALIPAENDLFRLGRQPPRTTPIHRCPIGLYQRRASDAAAAMSPDGHSRRPARARRSAGSAEQRVMPSIGIKYLVPSGGLESSIKLDRPDDPAIPGSGKSSEPSRPPPGPRSRLHRAGTA